MAKKSPTRPISVKFDDGTEWKVGNIYELIARLCEYVDGFPTQEKLREWSGGHINWPAIASEHEKQKSRKLVSKLPRGGQQKEIRGEWEKRRAQQPRGIPDSAITNFIAKKFKKTRSYVRQIIKGET